MKDRDFLDTNILVYAFDSSNTRKQDRAAGLLAEAIRNETALLFTQVLGEFFTIVTRKISQPLQPKQALEVLESVSVLPVLEVDLEMVRRAIRTSDRYRISYWDSLIIAAAERGGCTRLLSEDLNSGQCFYDIVVYNPFA